MLKFITEDYLRALYKKEAFEYFQVCEDQRLTPGGRQYLLDKKIEIKFFDKNKSSKLNIVVSDNNIYKLKSLDIEFLSIANELLGKSTEFTHELLEIKNIFKNIIDNLEKKTELIKLEEKSEVIKCSSIDENHLYHKNGKYIFSLKKLSFELCFFKNLFLKDKGINRNFDLVINKLEKLIHHMMEEL
jgi:hypothetical protein